MAKPKAGAGHLSLTHRSPPRSSQESTKNAPKPQRATQAQPKIGGQAQGRRRPLIFKPQEVPENFREDSKKPVTVQVPDESRDPKRRAPEDTMGRLLWDEQRAQAVEG